MKSSITYQSGRFDPNAGGFAVMTRWLCPWILLAVLIVHWMLPAASLSATDAAESASGTETIQSDVNDERSIAPDASWGGHLKLRGAASRPDSESIWGAVDADTNYDGNVEGRLNNTLFFSDWIRFDTQYETVLSGGDTRRETQALSDSFPDLTLQGVRIGRIPDDSTQVMDLTSVIREDDSAIWYHRLDRLVLGVSRPWGVLRIGRQAVTWGNGLVFNPRDLFNPFRPTDIEREYKLGTDLAYAQLPWQDRGNLQLLYVPRRNPETGDIEGNQSSLAGNLHLFRGTTEFDLIAAKHYEDFVTGLGGVGYLGRAAWRFDATWTILDSESPSDNYLSLVANMDVSWVWWRKNFYGFVEFYFNGLGEDDYQAALGNPDIQKRLERGELFVLGRYYVAALLQIELHPLFNVFITDITNLRDPSGIIQPRAVWDFAQNFQLIFGGNILYGARGTEYGGIDIPGTPYTTQAPDSVYLWLSYYF
jgi:hypothetical protein